MPIRAGRLRHRVEIQERSRNEAVNDLGESTDDFITLYVRWGSIEALRGRQLWQARELASETTHTITLRFLDGLNPNHRIKHGSSLYTILHIGPDPTLRYYYQVLVKEKVDLSARFPVGDGWQLDFHVTEFGTLLPACIR